MPFPPSGQPGVAFASPSAIHLDIQQQVARVLQGVPEGKTMAVVGVETSRGFNAAIAHKINQSWTVEAWVGKSGWQAPVAGGASIMFSR